MNDQTLLILIASLLIVSLLLTSKKREKYSHRWRKRSARKTLEKLQTFESNAQIFSYLRKIDAFVFEEMILLALDSRDDIKIIKSHRYTGDHGIDGQFIWRDGDISKKVLIQAKRYTGYINKQHAEDFCEVVKTRGADIGLFVHTGKTGRYTKQSFDGCDKVKVVSGQKMLNLLFKSEFLD